MSGNRNSGRRPAVVVRTAFSAPGPAAATLPAGDDTTRPPLSLKAASHWDAVVSEAAHYGTVDVDRDKSTLAKICEQLAVMDDVIKAKSGVRFSALSERGLRVIRVERQTTKELDRLWRGLRREMDLRASAPGGGISQPGPQRVPSIRDFAARKGATGA